MDNKDKTLLGMLLSGDDELPREAESCPVPKTKLPREMPYAMAYVPFQPWEKPYDCEAALQRGTAFPCLDKPFIGEEAVKNG
ncbi:MAG: spore coat associated protein CotJA [Ruminococcus sp.]|nr:spore coat associated protein CotJA [Ruminococcus sp.]